MSSPEPSQPSIAQRIASELTPDEATLAADAWFQYLQVFKLAAQFNPEQAESERRRLDRLAGRVGGIWQAFLVSHGYNFHDWEIRLIDPPADFDVVSAGGGAIELPTDANAFGVRIVPNTSPPQA